MNINYDYTQSLGPIIGIPLIMILYNDNRNRSESRRWVTGGSQWRSPKWTSFGRRLQRLRTGGQAGTCRDPGVTASRLGAMDLVFFNVFCSFFSNWKGLVMKKICQKYGRHIRCSFCFWLRQDLHDVLLPALGCPVCQNMSGRLVRFEWKNGWSWSEMVWDLGW